MVIPLCVHLRDAITGCWFFGYSPLSFDKPKVCGLNLLCDAGACAPWISSHAQLLVQPVRRWRRIRRDYSIAVLMVPQAPTEKMYA